ncbi:hypothetical protein [Endozoicomonas sp. 8E]|uniref:hypothetical protein n=1 Tax=Endozoicomonas sp. 8E TaxID=3035692 RepID=UPI0029395121|nr:hypothetical protein [Endozoicomonas sp. 8E]WOG26500.1 hypothetical protein P6910_18400 [Endozoicomonas sp. 8E]
MERLFQLSHNEGPDTSSYIAAADVLEKTKANDGNAFGRSVSPASVELVGINHADFTPVTGQKEIGISSRAVVLDGDSCEATKHTSKMDFTDARDIKPEAQLPRPLEKPKVIQDTNTALISDKQIKLIKSLMNGEKGRFTVDEFIAVIDFLNFCPKKKLPEDYDKSPTLLSGIIRSHLWDVFKLDKSDQMREVLQSTPERKRQVLLTDVRKTGLMYRYKGLPEELKNDIDFLTEYSSLQGIPRDTPPKLAVSIYEHLDIGAKIESIHVLPDSYKDEGFYDELIRSGRIELNHLPHYIREKNKEYCLLQLSKGLCRLSEVPDQFITKKAILDSLNSESLHVDFINVFKGDSKYKMLSNDSEFFEEVVLKFSSIALDRVMEFEGSRVYPLSAVYQYCTDRYRDDRGKLALLLRKLVKANPFFVIVIESQDDRLLEGLIKTGKESLLEMLSSRPAISQYFDTEILSLFFKKVKAGDDFKSDVMNVVFPYFPDDYSRSFPEDILLKQDAMVLASEPFDAGEKHLIRRHIRPEKAELIIDYIEQCQSFLRRFDSKKYLEKCCTDATIRQKLIHVLANRIIAEKQLFMSEWRGCVPRKLIDDTLAYLNNPALFSELDVSGTLAEPVNPLKFQQPNTSAFKLLASLHAYSLEFDEKDASRQLQSEFDRADRTYFEPVFRSQYPLYFLMKRLGLWIDSIEHPLSLFEGEGAIMGGRTLAVENGEDVDYYKFQRLGESVATLAQEGIMHQFIARVTNNRFKSQLPRFGQYLIVMEKDLPRSIRGFTDRLQVININGERAFRVYHFKATKNYAKYAHTPDTTSTPYANAERGLFAAIHDIGVLNGKFGVMPTSTIPAFHDTGRRWVFLSPLLGNSSYFALPLPGTFGSWVKAIERPDFGWDGLRDWGDVEFFGSMSSGLSARDSKTSGYTPEVLQRLSFVNSLCENLLAAVLLRARLRRDSKDYHYQNQQAVEETENFIEQLLNEYLSGLLAKEKEWLPRSRLQEFMGLDDTAYRSWLKRTAEEILYWTAMQPCETKDHSAFDPSVECFSKHIKDTGNLDTTLYPKGLRTFDTHKKFPKDFHNVNDQLNLGANNAVFPLVSLVKGLTLLAGNIFAFANQYTEDENREEP